MARKAITLWVVAAFVALLGSEGTAHADPKYSRSSKMKTIKVKQTERTRKLEPKKKKTSEVTPEISADAFIGVMGKVRQIRKAQIDLFKQLINDSDAGDPQLPDYLFRLADAYAQQQRYWRFKAADLFAAIDKAKGSKKSQLKSKQQGYYKQEKAYLLQSLKVYKALTENRKFRNFPKMDQALFYYAFTLQGAKYVDQARAVYQKLIKRYPKSKYIPEAFLSFADYYFNNNELPKAEVFYNKVLEFPKSPVYAYAMYKKGWVQLNQSRPDLALDTFQQVAAITERDKKRATLNKASKKDFVRAYAEVGSTQKAYMAFKRIDKKYAFTMLERLADTYLDQGKSEKAIFTFRELMSNGKNSQKICEWQSNVVRAMLSVGNDAQKVTEVENLVKIWGAYKGKLKGSARSECLENAQMTTNEMAKVWHNEAIKTLNMDTLAYVERLYKIYLDVFKKADDFGDMQYYYSELIWQRAESEKNSRVATELWERAAIAFTDVVKSNRVSKKMRKESAYAAVLGWKNALAVDPRTKVDRRDFGDEESKKELEPKPIGEREKKMIEAFDIYINYIKDPKDEELVMMKFLKARIYWRHDHLEETLPLFKDIIKNHSSHETAEYSANILLDSLIRLKRYDELLALADEMLDNKSFISDKDELKDRLVDIKLKGEREKAEQLEKDKKWVECGEAYRKIYLRNKDAKDVPEVLYNAGVCFESGKSIGLAIFHFEELSQKHPNHRLTQKALVRLGNNYGAIAYYDKAAAKYEVYAKRFGGEKDASSALSNAVLYRKGIGDDDQAIKNSEFFVKQFGRKAKEEAADALFSMTGIYEKRGDNDMVVKHLTRYLRQMSRQGGADRVVVAHAKMGQILWEQSCPKGKSVNGACIRLTRERTLRRSKRKRGKKGVQLPSYCGEASRIRIKVVDRDKRLVAQAKGHFKKAISAFGNGKVLNSIPGEGTAQLLRQAQATYWYGAAKFYTAEESYESLLSVKFPTGLNFNPEKPKKVEESKKKLLKWFQQKQSQAAKTTATYKNIVDNVKGGGAHWNIAAAARIGQIMQNFADGLYGAEVPSHLRTGPFAEDMYWEYCGTLEDMAKPLEDISINAFGYCLENTTKLNWFNEWSRLCEFELGQIRPQDFPSADETHAEADLVAPITDVSSVEIRLD